MRRNQMTWMAAALGAVALSGMIGCGKKADTGSASVSVGGQKLTTRRHQGHRLPFRVGSPPVGCSPGGQRRAVLALVSTCLSAPTIPSRHRP